MRTRTGCAGVWALYCNVLCYAKQFLGIVHTYDNVTAQRMNAFITNYHTPTYLHSSNSMTISSISITIVIRIFGCLARWECVRVKEAYDKGGYKRTLEVAIKTVLKGDLFKYIYTSVLSYIFMTRI